VTVRVTGPDGSRWTVRRSVLRGPEGKGWRWRWRGPSTDWLDVLNLADVASGAERDPGRDAGVGRDGLA
jgi:hypothetical protein